jgi:L-amino acid N-acyltransferase YncA
LPIISHNQGIEDRIATLEQEPKTEDYMCDWFHTRKERYTVTVAESNDMRANIIELAYSNGLNRFLGQGFDSVLVT